MTPLCRAHDSASGYFCTRPLDHPDDHIATLGPYEDRHKYGGESRILAQWPNVPRNPGTTQGPQSDRKP